MHSSAIPGLILASTSQYRARLLKNLGLPFNTVAPGVAETPLAGELPGHLASRLSREKAVAGSICANNQNISGDLVIGSDQVAHLDDQLFGQPGHFEGAREQLLTFSGQWVSFTTGLCLTNRDGVIVNETTDTFEIRFRILTLKEIEAYLRADKPFDCAGSIKAEGRGLVLLAETRGRDVNTLYGLPLICLVTMLRDAGVSTINYFN